MTTISTYSAIEVPRNMSIAYGQKNTFLISEYNAYRTHSNAFLHHIWNFLFSMMPPMSLQLPHYMSFDYYRGKFMQNAVNWAVISPDLKSTIIYWIGFDAEGTARSALAEKSDHERIYHYLPGQDEERLNRIMLEIDPSFTPVDTSGSRK